MLVAVDIGNTNIVLGFLDGDTIAGTYRITTKANHTSCLLYTSPSPRD